MPRVGTRETPLPPVPTSTTPRQKNWVPIVATRDGIPSPATIAPLTRPARIPASAHAAEARIRLFVYSSVNENAPVPRAMTAGNDRSISPAITTIVSGRATSAKKGVVDMNAW